MITKINNSRGYRNDDNRSHSERRMQCGKVCMQTNTSNNNQKWHGQDVWHDDNGWQKKPSEKDILIIITLFLLFIIYVSPICVFSIPERIFGSRTCRGGLSPKVIRSLQGESFSLHISTTPSSISVGWHYFITFISFASESTELLLWRLPSHLLEYYILLRF